MTKPHPKEPTGRKTYIDPVSGQEKKGAVVPLAKIRADAIWAKFKPYMDQIEVFGNRLIVGVFVTEKIRHITRADGSIATLEVPDSFREEDVWQGVAGLVLQVGPGCFKDTDKWKFHGQKAGVGDWITFQPAHTTLTKVGGKDDGIECRILQDCYTISKVSGPHVCS